MNLRPSPLSRELEPLSTSCFGSSNSPKLAEVSEIADDRGDITCVHRQTTRGRVDKSIVCVELTASREFKHRGLESQIVRLACVLSVLGHEPTVTDRVLVLLHLME